MYSNCTQDIITLKSNIPFLIFKISIDTLSCYFLVLLSVLTLFVSFYSIGYVSHYYNKRNVGLLNFLNSNFIISMIFVFISSNSILFFFSWEIMALLSYFLVVFESDDENNQKAGTIYIIMTHIGTSLLLISFILIYYYTNSFDIFNKLHMIPSNMKNILFILFLIGFGTKAGIVPLHIWLPRAHPSAPSNISALMSGIMIKTAIYGIIRFVLIDLDAQTKWWGITLLIIGMITTFFGIAYAIMESNMKKLLAYSSIENIGLIFSSLGVYIITKSQNLILVSSVALIAALTHTLNHSLIKSGLFLGAGTIQFSTHTKDIEKLGGLIKKLPSIAFVMICLSLSITSIIPFNGFIGEWLLLQSIFTSILPHSSLVNILFILSIAIIGLSGALAIGCFVKFIGISFLGLPRSKESESVIDVPITMKLSLFFITISCFLIGIFPKFAILLPSIVSDNITNTKSFLQNNFFLTIQNPNLSVGKNSIGIFSLLIIIFILIIFILILARIVGGKYIERKYGTWDCGFEALNSRMQYSASGFSKPIRIVFKILYRPRREFQIQSGDTPYYPKSVKYNISTISIFENYIYVPLIKKITLFSSKIKYKIQTGNIHSYLIYIFITILILLVYNKISI